jgi:hypothetical protein
MSSENLAQNVAQPVACQDDQSNCFCAKSGPTICAERALLVKIARGEQSPKWRKFAESGHPASSASSTWKAASGRCEESARAPLTPIGDDRRQGDRMERSFDILTRC